MKMTFGPRRAEFVDMAERMKQEEPPLTPTELAAFEDLDLVYRSLCALLYNYVPTSGHPGGSVSSGRFVAALLFDALDYDVSDPDRRDADLISYAAGHKALGLYALWALRNEVLRLGAPDLLPNDVRYQIRLEDLLGFRRNPTTNTPRFLDFRSKALDGHPTPATPFLRLATGASGVGTAASVGLALGALDHYGADAPRVHIVEGEGGMTAGRVSETMAAAGTASLWNATLHLDWNQASIDSDRVCRDGEAAGDYVQWNPMELAYLHDWNVVLVPDGFGFQQIIAAQRAAHSLDNGQPTAIIYRTVKGWRYGVEGKASHGAGHKLCSDGFHQAVAPLVEKAGTTLPGCDGDTQRCAAGTDERQVEECLWDALVVVRRTLEESPETVTAMAKRLVAARERLEGHRRKPREGAPRLEAIFNGAASGENGLPEELVPAPGTRTTLRQELGRALGHYNRQSNGALLIGAADLLGSTSVAMAAEDFPAGYWNARTNPGARLLSMGGICEDGMAGILAGISSYGRHIGVGSSYGAFLAALGHVAARLHAIGAQARQALAPDPYPPFVLVCAHAGLKTGEDGPTHADPQPLQLLQGNFPPGTLITLTPWDPQEVGTLMAATLARRPAVIAPFVTRPTELVLDRKELGLAPASAAASGVYLLRAARNGGAGTVVLQGSGVTYAFVQDALPRLLEHGIDLNVYYVASAELFDALSAEERERIFPEERAREAMGITGFTLPTMYRWVRSDRGRTATLHPFGKGHFLGSGPADRVLAEAGLDGKGQFEAIRSFVNR